MTPVSKSGFAAVNNANLYYEISGHGTPLVMIHAGVADNRQWNNEFASFANKYHVLRYDQRGYGKSETVDGDYSHLRDLESLLETLDNHDPLVLMGCSMGGATAMDFTLTHPALVKALIMVDSGPSGLELEVPEGEKFADAEKAFKEGNLDLVSEIETQIWFDGTGRTPQQVDQEKQKLVFEMNRIALGHGGTARDHVPGAGDRRGE
jgi:pimeloyl-ACP methyl ester carboxylesterase